jgi:hypothetical protein
MFVKLLENREQLWRSYVKAKDETLLERSARRDGEDYGSGFDIL